MESKLFEQSGATTDQKLKNFAKYVRRQTLARFLVQEHLFRLQLPVKGSIVECGVHEGGGLLAWAKLSSILEPYNYRRKVIGFDTFDGFPSIHTEDGVGQNRQVGNFRESYDTYSEISAAIEAYDANRFLPEISKIQLIKGNASTTIPEFLSRSPHTVISLLYLDFDIYEPTATALKNFLPRMPAGAVLAFDEVNNEFWPGETRALLEFVNLNTRKLECSPIEPNISWIVIE